MKLSKSFRIARSLVPMALVAVAACSDDDGGPKGGLSASDQTALVELIADNPAMMNAIFSGGAGAYGAVMLPFIASGIQSMGTIEVGASGAATLITPNGVRQAINAPVRGQAGTPTGTYRAFGGQFVFSVKQSANNTQSMAWTGIIAIDDIKNPTNVLTVGITSVNATAGPSSLPVTQFGSSSGDRIASGSYTSINGQQAATYAATTGSVAIDEADFPRSGPNCPGTAASPIIKTCKYMYGTIDGSFNFTASRVQGSGTVNIPVTTVSVPATRVQISIDATSFPTGL